MFIRENTAELLALTGYVVHTAENGKIGAENALATRLDLVICDITMSVLDGYGVLHIFNQNPQLAGVPLIFHTAKTERTDLRRGVELRAYDYLTKPFSENELLSAINGRLARFRHLKPYYDLKAGALDELLDDARAVGKLAVLAADRRAYPVRRKQDIYLEGDEPARVYLVQADRAKTVKTIEAGKELITGFYGPGEFFDYLALLGYTPHTDSAVAVDDSELVYILQDDFLGLLLHNPAVGQQFSTCWRAACSSSSY